jgi:hypothetical protein
MPKNFGVLWACLTCIGIGCGEHQPKPSGSKSTASGVKSYGELAAERAKATEESEPDPIPEALNPRFLSLINGLSEVEPLPPTLPDTFTLSSEKDNESSVPSRYRIAADQGSQALEILKLDQEALPEHQMRLLNTIDLSISSAMMNHLFGPLGGNEDYAAGVARLDPIRRTFWLASSAEVEAAGYGITTFIEQYAFLVPAAAIACRTLGMPEYADALQAPVDLMPRNSDGAILWWTYPLPDDVLAACERGQPVVDGSRRNERLHFAIRHPEYFFTHSADHFVPKKYGKSNSEAGND